MKFEEIFSVMKELADGGNEFFLNAVQEFENSDNQRKASMREWLEGEFDDYDPKMWSMKDYLLCMSFAE